jgi:hypothetical protein
MIVTRRQAQNEIVNSLFISRGTLSAVKFDSGKYKWHGSAAATWDAARAKDPKNVQEIESLRQSVWIERRVDNDGAYAQIMTLTQEKT